MVSLAEARDAMGGMATCPISIDAVRSWLSVRRREFTLDGKLLPTAEDVARRLSEFWLPDEAILYIGQTGTPLSRRVADFYGTPLGARRPHAGGHWIQTLSNRGSLYVHCAASDNPTKHEADLFELFCQNVSAATRAQLRDPSHPFPFANLESPRGHVSSYAGRKNHGLGGQREPKTAPTRSQ